MNNKRWVYRIAKGNSFYNIGPYGYLMNKLYEKENIPEHLIQQIKTILFSKERWYGHSYERNICEVLNRYPVFTERGCFATYKAHRPGPWDDPVLKHNILARFGNRKKLSEHKFKWNGFAFDSLEQMGNWFNDSMELKLLMNLGFKIHSEKINQKYIVEGLKQIWILKSE